MGVKTGIYAPRLRGDLDLGLESSRVKTIRSGITAKQWAEIVTPGGMLPGGVYQDIHEQSAEGVQNYRLGTRRVMDDRVFRYCYAGGEIAIPQRGVGNANASLAGTARDTTATEYTVDIPYRHADYSDPSPIPVEYSTVDVYKGGWLWIMGAGAEPTLHEFHRILGNDAVSALYVRVYLETPIKTTQTTPWITAYPNIYANCQQDYPEVPSPQQAVVCMTTGGLVVTLGRYFWGQTWGPSWTTALTNPGLTAYQRDLYFSKGGVLAMAEEVAPGTNSYQRAGYLLPDTQYESDKMFMLQLAP